MGEFTVLERLKRSRRLIAVGLLALGYVGTVIGVQAGARLLGLTALLALGAVLVVGVVLGGFKYRIGSILLAAILPMVLWIWVLGSYSFTRDILGGALGIAIAWPLARLLSRFLESRRDSHQAAGYPKRRFMRRFLILTFGLVWIINSSLNVYFEGRTLPRNDTPLTAARAPRAPWPSARVGVALSGGGYRAALMHAGVLAELDAMRVPVTAVSAVSGGSIIGSYYASGGDPEEFRDAMSDGRFNLKRDMADIHNALRLPFPFKIPYLDAELFPWMRFGRVDVQANLVDRVLLGGATLRDMQDSDLPRLQICTSDLRSGAAVGLSADGVAIQTPARPAPARSGGALPYVVEREFHSSIDPETRVAELVAASGAFPGAFSAVELELPATPNQSARKFLLADGGIVDNWGVGLLLGRAQAAGEHPWKLDLLLVSAGGRVFKQNEEVPAPEELRRAIDIVYETAGWRPVELSGDPDRPPIVLVQPGDLDESEIEYQTFRESNTLEDTFTVEEAQRLFELGRKLVRKSAPELEQLLNRVSLNSPPASP